MKGERRTTNDERRTANGERQTANGERRTANGGRADFSRLLFSTVPAEAGTTVGCSFPRCRLKPALPSAALCYGAG